ncbi:MAG: Holliday junction resolvase RuvX [Pyrinomonadaceae bacterium MAG19_C2-C3]|nr:Holliday junction resolvase RuvX [Pyrinomonadaceae bacterium MAG19_C2-C3]
MSSLNIDGRILALDLGTKRVGVAVSDESRIAIRDLPALPRTNWKSLLEAIRNLCQRFDARAVVVGLPLRMDSSEGEAAVAARRIASNLSLSLNIPVFLQDEKLTSVVAEELLRLEHVSDIKDRIDSRAASIILFDFIGRLNGGSDVRQVGQP